MVSLEAAEAELRRREQRNAGAEQDQTLEASKERSQSLAGFIREAWHVVEPGTPLVWGWHINTICAHLEAVTAGRITRLLINVPPGPMRDDSLVETARGPVLLREIRVGDEVLTHRGRYQRVTAVHQQGVLPILQITTNSGRVTHAAPSHPYLTPQGWVDAQDLRVGDVLAVVNRQQERPQAVGLPAEEARLLGYLVGDGSLTQGTTSFVNADREVIDDFKRCAAACGFQTTESARKSHWQVRVLGGNKVARFLESHGLKGKSSYAKRIPPAIMQGDVATIGNFVGGYWTCDGGFDVRVSKTRGSRFRAYGTTVSEGLARDLVYALGLLGIEARLRTKTRKLITAAQPGGAYTSYSIEVQRENMTARFADMPGLCSAKQAKAAACRRSFDKPLWDDPIVSIEPCPPAPCMCLTIDGDHSFVCSGIAVKNTMKSLIVSVFWPAWEWGPAAMPYLRYYTTSFKDELVTRDTRKMRDLVFSDWYRQRWGHLVEVVRGGEKNFSNTQQGWRIGSAWTSLTGERGHRLLIDDPHSTEQAESEAERKRAVRIFRESAPSRIVDPQTSAIIIVMQRLHAEDISGVALSLGDYVHLCLPMEFEADRACETMIGFKDPRRYEGELLFPERFSREAVDRDKRTMGPFAVAGQYQQRPQAREGGMFKSDWLPTTKPHTIPDGIRWVRYWDLAATTDQYGADPAYTVGVKLGRLPDGKFVVGDVARLRAEGPGVRRLMRDTAKDDGVYCEIGFSQDPGQAGKTQAADLVMMLPGYVVHSARETGDKETRAEPVAAQAAAGNLLLVEADWNRAFIDELTTFPGSKHKDQVDALSGAFKMLLNASLFATPEEWFTVDGGIVPATWPRVGALSFTASHFNAVWVAIEPATSVAYVYEAISVPRQDMAIHARTLTSRWPWLPFVMDWEDQGRSKGDNEALAEKLTALGVNLMLLPFSFEAAIDDMASKLPSAEIRVFANLTPWFAEYRRVSRNEKGQIEEAHAGILRSTGLAVTQGRTVAITENRARSDRGGLDLDEYSNRNPVTGY